MRSTWTNVTERLIVLSNLSVTCNSFRELHTLDWFCCTSELFRKKDFDSFMSWKTQPNCRAFDDRRPTGPCFNSWQISRLTSGLPGLSGLFVKVDNKLPYSFVQIIILQHGYYAYVIILLGPFHLVVHQPDDVHTSTFLQICNHSWSCRTSILEDTPFHRMELVQIPLE